MMTNAVRPGQIVVVAGRSPADRGEYVGAADTQEQAWTIAARSGIHHRMISYIVAGRQKLPREAVLDAQRDIKDVCDAVASMVRDDGTGDLGVIVRQALADDPAVTVDEIADIVREARRDAAVERKRERDARR